MSWLSDMLAKGWAFWTSPQALLEAARSQHLVERYQPDKSLTRYTYTEGPMFFLGQQIVKAMQDAGYPATIYQCFRSPDEQYRLYSQGRTTDGPKVTNALPFQSAHQLYEAVDIIHPERGWNVSPEYWETLAACVAAISERFAVDLEHGHHWKFTDSAHIELADWRNWRIALKARYGESRVPNARERWERFGQVLPRVVKRYEKDRRGPPPGVAAAADA